ncbi:MAG: ribosome-associated translation inhibitor RaiA [Proteobacteria bacterium]|nr:ribosome-associated translation inhibitor RaiA [Pseudomonadota bacterium]
MQLSISGHHVEISESLKNYINSKMQKVERHFDQVIDAHVVLDVEKQRHKAETTLQLSGSTIHAASENDDMYAAIDAMVDKLDRQVRKHKEKISDHHQREGGIKQHNGDD